jgi:hypothetical protein
MAYRHVSVTENDLREKRRRLQRAILLEVVKMLAISSWRFHRGDFIVAISSRRSDRPQRLFGLDLDAQQRL